VSIDEKLRGLGPERTQAGTGISRRRFLAWLSAGLGGLWGIAALKQPTFAAHTWQLDPLKCIQCERCATECVLKPSAVKCVHLYEKCGYCDLCSGYFIQGATRLDTGAENQLCPTGALTRTFIEEPYFEYVVDDTLCIGCGRCAKNCRAFGNASLILQIRHDLCKNCNQCAIARACPANAFRRVPLESPYLYDLVAPKGPAQGNP
jgi:Na+-translocating ferredoxin:NAD+ oxidoreductase subunit B